eukprot:jgi/Psemu1/63204/estExt_Genemark1.C_190134
MELLLPILSPSVTLDVTLDTESQGTVPSPTPRDDDDSGNIESLPPNNQMGNSVANTQTATANDNNTGAANDAYDMLLENNASNEGGNNNSVGSSMGLVEVALLCLLGCGILIACVCGMRARKTAAAASDQSKHDEEETEEIDVPCKHSAVEEFPAFAAEQQTIENLDNNNNYNSNNYNYNYNYNSAEQVASDKILSDDGTESMERGEQQQHNNEDMNSTAEEGATGQTVEAKEVTNIPIALKGIGLKEKESEAVRGKKNYDTVECNQILTDIELVEQEQEQDVEEKAVPGESVPETDSKTSLMDERRENENENENDHDQEEQSEFSSSNQLISKSDEPAAGETLDSLNGTAKAEIAPGASQSNANTHANTNTNRNTNTEIIAQPVATKSIIHEVIEDDDRQAGHALCDERSECREEYNCLSSSSSKGETTNNDSGTETERTHDYYESHDDDDDDDHNDNDNHNDHHDDDDVETISSEDLEYMYGTLPMDKLPTTPRTSNCNPNAAAASLAAALAATDEFRMSPRSRSARALKIPFDGRRGTTSTSKSKSTSSFVRAPYFKRDDSDDAVDDDDMARNPGSLYWV